MMLVSRNETRAHMRPHTHERVHTRTHKHARYV